MHNIVKLILEILKQLVSWTFEEIKSIARSDKEKNISRMAGDVTTDAPLPNIDKKKNSKIRSVIKEKVKKYLDLD